jgi:two-component system sensor histidine kinase RpfC
VRPPRTFAEQWFTRDGWAFMLASAQRAELEQTMLRVATPGLVLIGFLAYGLGGQFGGWRAEFSKNQESGLEFTILFFAIAIAMLLHILSRHDVSVPRRYLGIVLDNVGITYFMLVAGEIGAAVVAGYLFVTIGNGFRFGQRYLQVSQFLSLVGFTVVCVYSDFWLQHPWVVAGIYVTLLAIPLYVGVLAHRLQRALRTATTALDARMAA